MFQHGMAAATAQREGGEAEESAAEPEAGVVDGGLDDLGPGMTPEEVALLLLQQPARQDALIAAAHARFGNAFVAEVFAALDEAELAGGSGELGAEAGQPGVEAEAADTEREATIAEPVVEDEPTAELDDELASDLDGIEPAAGLEEAPSTGLEEAPVAAPAPAPIDIAAAEQFNLGNIRNVVRFDRATRGRFAKRNGQLDAAGVGRWQHALGLPATGMVDDVTCERAEHTPEFEQRTKVLELDLEEVIAEGTFPAIRARVYPIESAAGVANARARRAGDPAAHDLTGLGRLTSFDRFAAAMHGVQGSWGSFGPAERKLAIKAALDAELADAEVPTLHDLGEFDGDERGQFIRVDWAFNVNKAMIDDPTLSSDAAADLTNIALHETRHAEQRFLAARFDAHTVPTPELLATKHGLNRDVAAEAHARGMAGASSAEAAFAARMFDSMITHGADADAAGTATFAAITELDVRRGLAEVALVELRLGATPATFQAAVVARDRVRAQIKQVEARYHAYRSIPHEQDAHEVGDSAELAFRGATP